MRCTLCCAKITPEREKQIGIGSPVSCAEHERLVASIIAGHGIVQKAFLEGRRQEALFPAKALVERMDKLRHSIHKIEQEIAQVDPTKTPAIYRSLKAQLEAQKNYLSGLEEGE